MMRRAAGFVVLTLVFCTSSYGQAENKEVDNISSLVLQAGEMRAQSASAPKYLGQVPNTHECVLRATSCGANVTDSTDIFTCEVGGTYYDLWQFSASAGERLTIESSSAAYRVYMNLFDVRTPSSPVELTSGTASSVGTTLTLTATAPGTGNYMIAVGANNTAVGGYTFRITCGTSGPPVGSCTENSTTACMLNGRFRVTVRYRGAFDNGSPNTSALRKAVTGFSNPAYETSFFYFNDSNNIEMMVKMLDQGNTNSAGQRTIAVLFGSATPLRIEVTITDTQTGASKTYNSFFNEMKGTTDFTAFVK